MTIQDWPAEALDQCCPGGYHPIHLDDLVNDGQYEVLNKLGFGSFSTVWLAQDIQWAAPLLLHRLIFSLKCQKSVQCGDQVIVASGSEAHYRELQTMWWIGETGDPHHPGRKHVSQLLDWFYHDGPNIRHLCLVLELLGPQVSAVAEQCRNYRLDGNLARRVSQQLLYSTNHVRSCGVAHGGES